MKKLSILIPSLLLTWGLHAQDFDKAKMDSLFSRIERNQKGMGSISIFKNGKEVYQNSIGFADVENGIHATKNTKYRIGSITKTFTAVIIMQLIDENKLSSQTRLADHYPEIPNAKKITIEQLLRHRSGLYDFTNSEDYLNWNIEPQTKQELLKKIIKNGVVFDPDEKAEYSNTNYLLLSYIAERVDNKEFSEILEDRIIQPLGLKNTYYGGQINSTNDEALSYTKLDSWKLSSETDMSIPVGAGAVVSNPTDLNVFYNKLLKGELVSDSLLNEMKKIVDNYGIGLVKFPFNKKRAFGHTGGIDGFHAMAAYFPEDNVSIAYTSNGEVMAMNDILLGALSIYFGNDYTLPDLKPSLKLKSEDLDQYLGVYSSSSFPLKITISKKDNVLIGQATGQSSFPLEAFELHKFRYDQAMLKLEFTPEENKMILKQAGGEFEFTKE